MGLLGIVLAAAAGLWYGLEGHQFVDLIAPIPTETQRAETRAPVVANDLPTIYLDIGPEAYRTLKRQRENALREGIPQLESAPWVDAQARLQEETTPVTLRLMADWVEALRPSPNRKWPFEVQTQSETAILGMRSFSLRSPASSGYVTGWLYLEDLRRAGILAPRQVFVNVRVNGKPWGVYAMQESLSASQVFDSELMGRYLALADLWGARSGLEGDSEWYAHSPSTSALEPAPAYAFPSAPWEDTASIDLAGHDVLEIMEAYAQEVARITRPEYLEELRTAYADENDRTYIALAQEFASLEMESPWSVLSRRQMLLQDSLHPPQTIHARQIGGELNGAVNIQVCNLLRYPVALEGMVVEDRAVDIRAEWIAEDDRALLHPEAAPRAVLRRAPEDVPRYVTVRVPAGVLKELTQQGTAVYTGSLKIVTSLVGVEGQVVFDVRRDDSLALSEQLLPAPPSLEEALAQYPFLRPTDRPGLLALEPGTWHVEGDLVLPRGYGLEATRPVTLIFDRNALLFASGPLTLLGAEGGGIHLIPAGEDWGGVVVLQSGSGATSLLRNVEVRGTSGIQRGGWRTPGGITFYESPFVLSRCQLRGATAGAALHVVRSDFEIIDTEFDGLAAGAFAADHARGRIEGSTFHDVRGNGIEVSAGEISVQDASLLRVYGYAILAREHASLDVDGVQASEVHVALASVDGSSLRVRDAHISRAWGTAFAAYRAEIPLGTARIQASDVTFADDSIRALVQKEARVQIDGETILATGLDMAELERQQAALRAMRPMDHRLGSEIRLVGYDLPTPRPAPGDTLVLTLYWHALDEVTRDYTVFVHVRDAAGQTVVGWDNMPCQDGCPTTGWRAGRLVEDTHLIPLPHDLAAGEYRVAIGLYHLPTGERLAVYDPQGAPLPDATLVLGQTAHIR